MELRKVIFGQAVQFVETGEPQGRRSPVPLIREMQDRYGFVEVPRRVVDLDFTAGVTFLQGYFRDIMIDKFQVYNNGLLCEAAADNHQCAEFLDEILDWAPPHFNVPVTKRMKAFQSKLEISSTKDIRATFAKFAEIGDSLARLLVGYGLHSPPYVAAGLVMQHEPQKDIPSNPNFEFTWRTDEPFEARVYYSSAPLRTKDHMEVLNLLEGLL
jgi:hypothetical protein